ncbi:MMPL family transporter [Pseudomonadales bacterium]|nr:MMPL family transporter [Pseudomonadales bacterium]MDC3357863.1 MMPL family transporter [Pseudomonadales bacterium]
MTERAGSKLDAILPHLVIKYRWLIIALTIVMVVGAGSGMRFLTISTEYRDNFGPNNPQLLAFEKLEATFSRVDNIFFGIAPKKGDAFTPETLQVVADLTDEAWKTKGVSRVDSLTNYQHTKVEDDDLLVDNLVEFPAELSTAEMAEVRRISLNEPLIENRLISKDGKVTGINVEFRFDKNASDSEVKAAHWAWDQKAAIMAAHPGLDVFATGSIIISATFSETSMRDLSTQTPLMFLLVIFIMALLLRSVVGVIAIVLTTLFTIVCTMGTAGWLGFQISPLSSQAPVILLTVAVAHGVHLLVSFYQEIREGNEKTTSLIDALTINIHPITLTSISTAIGFLSLNVLADVPPIQDIGNIVAIGVVYAFVFSLTFLPVFVYLMPTGVKPGHTITNTLMAQFAEWVIRRRSMLLSLSVLASVVLVSLAPMNIVSDQFSKYFGESIQLRHDTDFLDQNLGGLYRIEYSLDSGKPQGVSDPEYLARVEQFAQWYRQQEHVTHVNTYTDIVKRLSKNLNGDDEAWYRLPETQNLAAQYLLLYELSLPFGLDLTNLLSFDKSASRMIVSVPSLPTPAFIELQENAKAWLHENAPELEQEGSSTALMFTHIGIRGMLGSVKGALIALVLIAIVLLTTLRSVKIGLISLVPNLLPGATGFGVWYLMNGHVGQSLSLVLGVTMGIVVDDTVHFLSKYLRARRVQGLSAEDAVRYAFQRVGVALWITTLVLISGFMMLGLSDFRPNGDMGLLVSIVIGIALILDFLLLPPLLILLDGDKSPAKIGPTNESGSR